MPQPEQPRAADRRQRRPEDAEPGDEHQVAGEVERQRGDGDGRHIGAQSILAAGVTIGSQCVIGANSFVKSDVPDQSIAAGSPALVIGRVAIAASGVQMIYDKRP